MDPRNRLGEPLAGPISSEAIEAALATDWLQLHSTVDGQPGALARASVLTLIVAVADPERADHVLDAISHLARQHPSRTVVLRPEPAAKDPSTTTSSSRGTSAGGTDAGWYSETIPGASDLQVWHETTSINTGERERLLCGEQVVIAARGRAVRHLVSLADQLTLPDLPTYLWWAGDLPSGDDGLLEPLTELADRLIVDSSRFRALRPAFERVDRIARRRHAPCAPSDLNWARLTPWRDLLAQFFDAPTLRPYLDRVTGLAITHDPRSPEGIAQALLLVSWLADRLGWQLDAQSRGTFSSEQAIAPRLRDPRGRPIEVTVAPDPTVPGPGGLRSVALRAGEAARFVVWRDDDGAHAHTEADLAGAPVLRRAARFEPADLSVLLADELMLLRPDHVFEATLAVARKLAGEAA